MNLAAFNQLDKDAMRTELLACCHAARWAEAVAAAAPFASFGELVSVAEKAWDNMAEADVLEAFSGHPRIGDLQALRNKYAVTATAEQGQVADAEESVLVRLKDENDAYLEKFGFIFIVCASGKSAAEMLALLEERINNSRDEELANGAREQMAITRLRLQKLIDD